MCYDRCWKSHRELFKKSLKETALRLGSLQLGKEPPIKIKMIIIIKINKKRKEPPVDAIMILIQRPLTDIVSNAFLHLCYS